MAVPNDAAQNNRRTALGARFPGMTVRGGGGVVQAGPIHGIRLKHVLLFLPWLALLGWFSRVAWFLCDDAFISFRYVRNLLEGRGLVFNPGEYVEGYSNFLWVLELAAVWGALGVPPEQAAPWLSAACTAATVAALLWWVARLPHLQHRGMTAWMALGLLCSSATFAVWTSGGGLETRQFTFFIVLAVVCLSLYRDSWRGLLTASLSLAAAALTRPEGPLLAALCFGWFVIQRMADTGRRNPDWRRLLYLTAPFVILVGAHFLWRYAYYGEWLPNTYYAKHVRPWYESGFRYLWAAALETGLYLLIPLSFAALRERLREYRDGTYALALLLVGVHVAYVLRVGGDHFEYRPLDFYWPLLALPAAAGIVHLGSWIAARRWLRRFSPRLTVGARTCAIVLFVPVLFYCNAFQGALLFAAAKIDEAILRTHVELDDANAGRLMAAPGMPMLVAISNDLRRGLIQQFVAMRFVEHRELADLQIGRWQRYENMDRGVIPGDALWSNSSIGISSYYAAGVKVLDRHGLTNAVVARNPVSHPNRERHMAHDRWPPPGYLEERGVNITIYAAESSADRALSRAEYALKVGPDLWMPFDSPDRQWVFDRFAGRDLQGNSFLDIHPTIPSGNRMLCHAAGGFCVGERFLGAFENGFDGWRLEGDAVTNHGRHAIYKGQQPVSGNVGPGFLTSFHPDKGDQPTGRALSPEFTATADLHLVFLIAGGRDAGVGLRLLVDGEEAAVWRGGNTEWFRTVVHPLAGVAGKRLQLELFDNETGGWGPHHARPRAAGAAAIRGPPVKDLPVSLPQTVSRKQDGCGDCRFHR